MDTISSFWAGAQDLADRVDLDTLATGAGGWRQLSGVSVADLVDLGVSLEMARRWLRTGPRHTHGAAITRTHELYPPVLAERTGAPPVLFVEGDTALLRRRSVAVVGTRRCTPYGASIARHLGGALAAAGIVVVSGLARGVDTHAHRGAIRPGRTLAVLGHGLTHTAPPSNRSLRNAILSTGGALLSAFPDEHPPARWTFPSRNRWIAGLCRDLVVVEAPKGSGALITAGFASDVGCTVHVVPGPLGVSACRGSNQLIQDGAQLVLGVEELVADLTQTTMAFGPHPAWLSHILAGGTLAQASRLAGTSAVGLLEELTRLELEGRLVRLAGGRYAATGGEESPPTSSL